ncbi:MAG: hypothetical protein U9Q20_04620 [Campylobacterota bacterium]|nr:hypothetical protein [Campylobacterota bacterium]
MNLDELKKRREANILAHKKKKKAYYLKTKLLKSQKENSQKVESINYEVELFGGNFALKLKEIAKKQKQHMDSREDIIKQKILEYREKKKNYYNDNKEQRLEYDKEYREQKKEKLKEYRKEYYRKNKEKILAKQKENRLKQKLESK